MEVSNLVKKVEIRSDGRNLGSPVPFVLMLVGFEMYQGVSVDDMIAKLQGATGFQRLHRNSFRQRQFRAWSINAVLLSVETCSIVQNNKAVSG